MNCNDQLTNCFAIPPKHPLTNRKPFHSIDMNVYSRSRSPLIKRNATQRIKNLNCPALQLDSSPLKTTREQKRIYSPNTSKAHNQCATTRSRSPNQLFTRGRLTKQKSFFLPMQYEILTEQRKKLLKDYYKGRKEIRKKYEDMLIALSNEEADAIKLAKLKHMEEEEVREDYAISANLIQQQKLIEEEELVKKYKETVLETYI